MVNAAKWQAVVLCGKHGSGQRCEVAGRGSMALGNSVFCEKHGGGQRCEVAGCGSMARGKTVLCGKHGGGQRFEVAGCGSMARGKQFCVGSTVVVNAAKWQAAAAWREAKQSCV